jgi:hypothetical protein
MGKDSTTMVPEGLKTMVVKTMVVEEKEGGLSFY